MDKKRLVEALQSNNEVVAVTGDGTNDAPALKAAHVGLSMGDGTSVAKEASDITIVDNSFTSIGRAVMWVNLIMDTFAAMALASLPPSESVMDDKPRSRSAFIISRSMWRWIIGTGGIFFLFLLGLLYCFEHTDITSLTQIGRATFGADRGLTPYELSLFFTIFVFLQFWNMFNARAYATGRSALHLEGCSGFGLTALIIVIGQILIVTVGGEFFSVVPLRLTDWLIIVAGTSVVLWAGELLRRRH